MFYAPNRLPNWFRLPEGLVAPEVADEVIRAGWARLVSGAGHPVELADTLKIAALGKLNDDQAAELATILRNTRLRQQQEAHAVDPNLRRALLTLRDQGMITFVDHLPWDQDNAFDIISDRARSSDHWKGYVFYDQVDVERSSLLLEGSVWLTFGVLRRAYLTVAEREAMTKEEVDSFLDARAVELAEQVICPELEKAGMTVEWNGTPAQRLMVHGAEVYHPIR
ncbi:MAG: hypothetical protein Q4C87_02670 [Actinomycetaceae bacterium]|nr:hypothetical protein [Actinomycetaceae bacterium]